MQTIFIGLRSRCSVRRTVVGLQSSCSAIGRTVGGHGWIDTDGRGWIDTGGCGWIDTGGRGWINTDGIRGEAAAVEAATEAAAEVIAAVVWFIDRGRSAKGRQDCLFLPSYIYRVRKVVGKKE